MAWSGQRVNQFILDAFVNDGEAFLQKHGLFHKTKVCRPPSGLTPSRVHKQSGSPIKIDDCHPVIDRKVVAKATIFGVMGKANYNVIKYMRIMHARP